MKTRFNGRAAGTALGSEGNGVIITQVVPHYDDNLPGVVAYRKALEAYAPDAQPGFVSLEGYLDAKIFVAGLRKAGAKPTRESVVDGLQSLHGLDIGIGVPVSYSAPTIRRATRCGRP